MMIPTLTFSAHRHADGSFLGINAIVEGVDQMPNGILVTVKDNYEQTPESMMELVNLAAALICENLFDKVSLIRGAVSEFMK